MGISGKTVNNEKVMAQTQLEKIDLITKGLKREKTEMPLARSANGRQQTAKSSCTLEYKEKARKTTKELDRHHT